MVYLLVVNDLFLLVFGLVETIEDLLASPSSCSLENLEVYWDTLSRLHLPRNLHVDFYSCPKSAFVSNPSKFERARKSLHFFSFLRPLISPKCRVDIDGFILESLHPSICSVEIKHVSLRAPSDDNGLIFES
jgi:hypothetical protein